MAFLGQESWIQGTRIDVQENINEKRDVGMACQKITNKGGL